MHFLEKTCADIVLKLCIMFYVLCIMLLCFMFFYVLCKLRIMFSYVTVHMKTHAVYPAAFYLFNYPAEGCRINGSLQLHASRRHTKLDVSEGMFHAEQSISMTIGQTVAGVARGVIMATADLFLVQQAFSPEQMVRNMSITVERSHIA